MSKKTDEVKSQVKDLLNQVAILLKDVRLPEVVNDFDGDGYSNIPVRFVESKTDDRILTSIKSIVEGMITDIDGNRKWCSESEKMARAYYSSFCNG